MKEVINNDLIELYKLIDDYLKVITKEKESYKDGE